MRPRTASDDVIGLGRLDVLGYEIPEDKPVVLINEDGTLTRAGAMAEARKRHGDMAMISINDYTQGKMVWEIGYFGQTIGRGKTWEEALKRSRVRKKESK